ncbi:Short-chain dehydrogenase/reductase SDR [Dillenia turbinata]|uniref:Short-chain dehydrogenase/reductase SDR n=1 Tax=Dillenia turbinata TaxID=194707 RepID=A0AAN8VHW4_9MAGN
MRLRVLKLCIVCATGLPNVVFHQLDATDPASIASLANFAQTHYKKLDILVNNVGYGVHIDQEAYTAYQLGGKLVNDKNAQLLKEIQKETYETEEKCITTNYYGTKEVTEALPSLLQLSSSARILLMFPLTMDS